MPPLPDPPPLPDLPPPILSLVMDRVQAEGGEPVTAVAINATVWSRVGLCEVDRFGLDQFDLDDAVYSLCTSGWLKRVVTGEPWQHGFVPGPLAAMIDIAPDHEWQWWLARPHRRATIQRVVSP